MERPQAIAAAATALEERVDAAATLDEDRILRSLQSFVTACVRTNWFQTNASGRRKPYASFKLDSAELTLPGEVVPYRGIFVYANDVEGIHARAGAVARGGIRFSDRPEDYRTEVLGLMKTQDVKNSPIVPVGAKGAFIRKSPEVSVVESYSTFIEGLLDVTDNLVGDDEDVHERTVAHDAPDTYVVVAADKGTASFSDVANAIATDRSYWLGDAFASGGATGYDHKAMGITARGDWVSVRHHLRDLGIDVQTDPVSVVGIGDMSGDVFGNGMLLSKTIKLVAAFDHRHIFVDPEPDPDISYAERERLSGTPHPSWADYDRGRMSTGGGIWSRTAKTINLPVQAQQALGVNQSRVTPDALIKAILRAQVDLLWNGGIGTYVKSSTEAHTSAADPSNDAVRVDAAELRCSVVGEGGNLGFTQRARIEFALKGGRINADFIDNAAGVATSDLEVNLKIALNVGVRSGRIGIDQRNTLLADSEPDVARAVIENTDNQVLAIGLAESQAAHLLNRHERLIDHLESNNGISRAHAVLPSKNELVSRTQAGLGLTRPEIAVLLAQSKNVVRVDLLESNVPEDAIFGTLLRNYFPEKIREKLTTEIDEHRLAREITATKLADDLINHVGPGLIYQLEERLGVKTPDVARAYAVVRDVFDIDTMWAQARYLQDDQHRWQTLLAVQQFIEQSASWILRRRPVPLDIDQEIQGFRDHAAELLAADTPATAPEMTAKLRFLTEAFELSETARQHDCTVGSVANLYRQVSELLSLSWLVTRLEAHVTTNWWDSMAAAVVRDDIAERHHELVRVLMPSNDDVGASRVSEWQARSQAAIGRFTRMTAEIRRDGVVDVSRACTISAELRLLIRSAG